MTLTVSQLLALEPPLAKLLKVPMGARCAFRLGHAARLLVPHFEATREARLRLYTRYGNDDGHGNITVPEEHMAEFTEQSRELLDEKVTVNVKPIHLDDLAEVSAMTAEELLALSPLIVE